MITNGVQHSRGSTTDCYEIYVDLRAVATGTTTPLGPYVPPAIAAEFSRGTDGATQMSTDQGPWGLSTALRSRGAHRVTSSTRPLPGRDHRPDTLRPKRTMLSRVAARLIP